MATATRPAKSLPNPGSDLDAEPVRDFINNILTMIEGNNIDENNVDYTSTDGIMALGRGQTTTGLKRFENTSAAAGGVRTALEMSINPSSGTAADNDGARFSVLSDDDGGAQQELASLDFVMTDASAASEDARVDIRTIIGGTSAITASVQSAGSTLYSRDAGAASVKDILTLSWDPADAAPVANQGVGISFVMSDDGNNQDEFASLDVVALDETATTEDAVLNINLITAGTVQESLTLVDGTMSFRGAATIDTSGNNALTLNAGTEDVVITASNIEPNADDGSALGTSGTAWSDLFLASGAVINFNAGDVTLTHSANTVTVAGGTWATAALTASTITGSGILSIDDVTDSTSGTTGSIHTDGGLGVAKDLFALVVNATGDTSAGDLAAMGYTSTEGLILTGQGSTSDVTIKNDADGTVWSVATGTTTSTFAGNMVAQTITGSNAAGPAFIGDEAATATNPTLVPNKTEEDTGFGWAAADTLTAVTGGTEAMRIDSSQNVGIGGSPSSRLELYTSGAGQTLTLFADYTAANDNRILFQSNDSGANKRDFAAIVSRRSGSLDLLKFQLDDDTNLNNGSTLTDALIIQSGGSSTVIDLVTTGTRIDFDTDNDTSIRASADDNLDIEVGAFDIAQFRGGSASTAVLEVKSPAVDNSVIMMLTVPASATSDPYIYYKQGDGGGTANNMGYQLGYDSSENYFRLLSTDSNGSATNADVFRVSDGTDDVYFAGGISTDGQAAPTSGIVTNGSIDLVTTGNRIDFDTDGNTSIRASADDVLTFEVGASDDMALSATGLAVTNSVTGATIEATGDTSAGDNAALGYTATEGLILTGQGSSNDVTIKNDADAAVLTIATGTTNVDVVGDLTAGTFTPDGDTAAGDSAAVGYTAAEGLILTGQGSSYDVTIKNDADAVVLSVATGGTAVDIVGDVTAATVNADGDTAAGDAAAMGYTATEGLILTGQGSSADVTIKNDADATVWSVATGTTTSTFAGNMVAQTITGSDAAGPALIGDEAATATNPTLVPNKTEEDTGFGWAAADTLTAVTGGTEAMRIDSSQIVDIGGGGNSGLGADLQVNGSAKDPTIDAISWSTTTTHQGTIALIKSASATVGTFAETADGENLGRIIFYGADSSSTISGVASSMEVVQNGASGAEFIPADIVFKTGTNSSAATEAIRITSSKQVIMSGGATGILDLGTTGYRIDFDTDNDTSIRASADDVLTVEAGATDVAAFTATALTMTGNINPEADGTRDLGTQTTAQWANLWADSVNGADITIANKWRMVESELYDGYPVGWAVGHGNAWQDGVSLHKNPETMGGAKPTFVVTDEFIEYAGHRITPEQFAKLAA